MKVVHLGDDYWREYNYQDATRLLVPQAEKIFVPPHEPGSVYGVAPNGSAAFVNPDWKVVVLPIDRDHPYCFSPPPYGVPECCPEPPSNEPEKWDGTVPLWIALLERDIFEVIHMGPRLNHSRTPDSYALSGDPLTTYDTTGGAIGAAPLMDSIILSADTPCFEADHASTYLFSREASWGVWWTERPLSVLGGEPDLVDRVVELFGGERFYRMLVDYTVNGHAYYCKKSSLSLRGLYEDVQLLYGAAGWEPPAYVVKGEDPPPLDAFNAS
jgi:hypothetical protein